MSEILDLAIFPMAFFVKIAPVDRATIENWMRSTALIPAKSGASKEGPAGLFSGPGFSLRNLMKIEIMHRLRDTMGVQAKAAATIAEALIEDASSEIEEEFKSLGAGVGLTAKFDERAIPIAYVMKSGDDGRPCVSRGGREHDSFMLIAPMTTIARLCFAKYRVFDAWAAVELPKLREALSKASDDHDEEGS